MTISPDQPSTGPEEVTSHVYYPSDAYRQDAHIGSMEQYRKIYQRSIENVEQFWREMSSDFYFKTGPKEQFLKYNFDIRQGPIEIKWLEGATTNVCYNMLDRHIARGLGDRTAFIW